MRSPSVGGTTLWRTIRVTGGSVQAFVLGRVARTCTRCRRARRWRTSRRSRRFVGGFGGNVGTGLARLGVRTAVVSGVGDDGLGRFLVRALAAEGDRHAMASRPSDAADGARVLRALAARPVPAHALPTPDVPGRAAAAGRPPARNDPVHADRVRLGDSAGERAEPVRGPCCARGPRRAGAGRGRDDPRPRLASGVVGAIPTSIPPGRCGARSGGHGDRRGGRVPGCRLTPSEPAARGSNAYSSSVAPTGRRCCTAASGSRSPACTSRWSTAWEPAMRSPRRSDMGSSPGSRTISFCAPPTPLGRSSRCSCRVLPRCPPSRSSRSSSRRPPWPSRGSPDRRGVDDGRRHPDRDRAGRSGQPRVHPRP